MHKYLTPAQKLGFLQDKLDGKTFRLHNAGQTDTEKDHLIEILQDLKEHYARHPNRNKQTR